jgi:hypothetical protein
MLPSMKVTDPLGVVVGELTPAVNRTACPKVDGLTEDKIVVCVIAGLIFSTTVDDVLVRVAASPV